MYDPFLGRWLTRDPAGYVDGLLLYAYVNGNPLILIDPLGLWGICQWLGLAPDPDAPGTTPNVFNYLDTVVGGYYESIWENTGGKMIDGAVGTANMVADRAQAGWAAATGDMSGVLSTDIGQNYLERAIAGDSTAEAILNVQIAQPATAIAGSVGETLQAAASGDVDAIGTLLRLPAEIMLGAKGLDKAAKAGTVLSGTRTPRDILGHKLNKSLASSEQIDQVGESIAGAGSSAKFRNVDRIVNDYGGSPADWAKMRSGSHLAPDGVRFETHWVENIRTHQRLEFKTKFAEPM